MENEFIRLDIVLVPSRKAAEKAICMSQMIGRETGTNFVLDNLNFYPHITLYSPAYPAVNVGRIVEEVGKIAKETPRIKLVYKELKINSEAVTVDFEKTPAIDELHRDVVARLNPLRDGYTRPKYLAEDYQKKMTAIQNENNRKYGFRSVMGLFVPHMTITGFKNPDSDAGLKNRYDWDIPEFFSDEIAIYEMGDFGTCVKLVRKFKLG